eukprot:PhM_4_TR10056/c3_g1_i1/m.42452
MNGNLMRSGFSPSPLRQQQQQQQQPYGSSTTATPQHNYTNSNAAMNLMARTAKQQQQQQQHTTHLELVAELKSIVDNQRSRVEKLKVESAIHIEHQAALRRRELEKKRSDIDKAIRDLEPALERVRSQWAQAKASNSGFENTWSGLKMQHNSIKSRVDVLKDSLSTFDTTIEDNRRSLSHMKDHIAEVENDKASMRIKLKRALECVVVDEDTFANRTREEEQYLQQLLQAHRAIEAELNQAQSVTKHDIAPLEDEVRVLAERLKEMQNKTADLFQQSVDAERRVTSLQEEWLSNGYTLQEDLERAGHLLTFKNAIINYLERQIQRHQQQYGDTHGKRRGGTGDTAWLTQSIVVWEGIVREAQNEKQRLQLKSEPLQRLAETTAKCHEVKTALNNIRNNVFACGPAATSQRKRLVLDLCDMRALVSEKKAVEDQLMRHLQELALVLNEDLATVMRWVRRETFDDYVSSTDGENDIDVASDGTDLFLLRDEGDDDIVALHSCLDIDVNDPHGQEELKRMAHRPEGPLREFAARRAAQLQQSKSSVPGAAMQQQQHASPNRGQSVMETFERAMLSVQCRVATEVVNHVRHRYEAINGGQYDPKLDRVVPDQEYFKRVKEQRARVEQWKSDQKTRFPAAGGSTSMVDADRASPVAQRRIQALSADASSMPSSLASANPVSKAVHYLTRLLQGAAFLVYFRNGVGPHMRHVFLSANFNRVLWRRMGSESSEREEDGSMEIAKIVDVTLGHQTAVMQDHRARRQQPMREDTAFSLVTGEITLDMECDSAEERNYWAQAFAWVVNESGDGGVIASLRRAGRLLAVDTRSGNVITPNLREPADRSTVQAQVVPATAGVN